MNFRAVLCDVCTFVKSPIIQEYFGDECGGECWNYLLDNPNLCFEAQKILFDTVIYRVLLAEKSWVLPEIQLMMVERSYYNSSSINLRLAKNPNICEEAQLKLSKDHCISVRDALAGNLGICKEVQMILAKDEDNVVRDILRGDKNLCKEAFEMLSI